MGFDPRAWKQSKQAHFLWGFFVTNRGSNRPNRWLWVVTGNSTVKVKPNVTDKHTKKHYPWHHHHLFMKICKICKQSAAAGSPNALITFFIRGNLKERLWTAEKQWSKMRTYIGKISLRTFMLVGEGIILGAERKSLKDDETCETMLRCWQSIKCKIPDAQS